MFFDFHFFNLKSSGNIIFILINTTIFICIINSFDILSKSLKTLRKLEEDPRTKGANMICMQIDNNDLYDLINLTNKIVNVTENITLKFCENFDNYKSTCIYKDGKTTKKLSGDIQGEKGNNNKVEIKNGIVNVYLSAGDKFNDTEKYKVNIEIKCDKNAVNNFTLTEKVDFDINKNYILNIKGNSSTACPLKEHYGTDIPLWAKIVIGIILLGVGIYVGFFGYKGRAVGIFIVCIVGLVFLSTVILDLCNEKRLYVRIIIMVVFGLVGIGISIFFVYKQKFLKIYMAIIGGLSGYAVSSTLINAIISVINTKHQKLIKIIVMVVLILTGIILGIFVTRGMFIVGTSLIGSYCLMRALSLFLDKVAPFVDELKIYDLVSHGNYERVKEMVLGIFLIYPGILIVLIIVTIVVQFKINPKWKDVDDYKLLEKNFEKPADLPDFRIQDDDSEKN